jgi:hypothetical protein
MGMSDKQREWWDERQQNSRNVERTGESSSSLFTLLEESEPEDEEV